MIHSRSTRATADHRAARGGGRVAGGSRRAAVMALVAVAVLMAAPSGAAAPTSLPVTREAGTTRASGIPQVTMIATRADHTCILVAVGAPRCWGTNIYGQLGDGTAGTSRTTPVPVTIAGTPLAGKTLTQIATGSAGTCALASDSTIGCWGRNPWGQLGNGGTTNSSVPVAVTRTGTPLAGKTITQVAVGSDHACALATDSTVACWGLGTSGQLGNGGTANSSVPVAVTRTGTPLAGKTIAQIAAGGAFTCARATDSTLACWGEDSSNELGNGGGLTDSPLPVAVAVTGTALAGKALSRLSLGDTHACALATDSTLACWGNNTSSQLGNGGTSTAPTPTAVTRTGTPLAGKTLTRISAGSFHTCALASDSTLACWGRNAEAQVGDGTFVETRTTPVAVTIPGSALAGTTVTDVSVGTRHSCALGANGPACWGRTDQVGLGWGSSANQAVAVVRGDLGDRPARRFGVGDNHACASTDQDVISCWGDSFYGQLGSLSPEYSAVPRTLPLSGPAVGPISGDIGGGGAHTCAIRLVNQAVCWGRNESGQSVGTPSSWHPAVATTITVAVSPLTPRQMAAGDQHTCSVDYDNSSARCWGENGDGQLGNSSTTDAPSPVTVTSVGTPWAAKRPFTIGAGAAHTCMVAKGVTFSEPEMYTPVCWGDNGDSQLGNGTTNDSTVPVKVSLTAAIAGRTLTQIVTGAHHSCVLASDSRIACWGDNAYGQLGNGTNVDFSTPIAVVVAGTPLAGKTITTIAAGANHTCAAASDGTIACWGSGALGALGVGNGTSSTLPVAVKRVGTPLAGRQVADLDLGSASSCALATDGTIACWGANSGGQLGAGWAYAVTSPAAVNLRPDWAPFTSWDDGVTRIFTGLLGRAPTTTEASTWRTKLTTGAESLASLVATLRLTADHTDNVDPVARLYRAYFLRVPDASGLQYWIGQRRGGRSLASISQAFAGSSEFTTRYGSLDNRAFVNQVYLNVLGRPGDTSGVDYWTGQLDSGAKTRGQVMLGFSESAEYVRTQVGEATTGVLYVLLVGRAATSAEYTAGVSRVEGLGTTTFAEDLLASRAYLATLG